MSAGWASWCSRQWVSSSILCSSVSFRIQNTLKVSIFFLDSARSRVNVGFLPGTRFHHLPNSIPRASGQILAERLLYQRHENGPLGVGDVGTVHLGALDTQDLCLIQLNGQLHLRSGPGVEQRDNPFGFGREVELFVGVGRL